MQRDSNEYPLNWRPTTLGACCKINSSSMSYSEFLDAVEAVGPDTVRCMAVKVSDMNLPGNEVILTRANAEKLLPYPIAAKRLVPPNVVVMPKRGAAIATNKKRLTGTWTALDPNLIALRPNDCLNAQFLFYWFLTFDLRLITDPGPTPQLNKKDLAPVKITVPRELDEQQQIVALLSAMQRTVEQQERLIALTAELKKALMHKLFTEGTRSQPLKDTDIGPMPETWKVNELGEHLFLAQYGLSVKGSDEGATPILRMTNQVDGRIVPLDLQMVNIESRDRAKFKVEPLDILFNRTNSHELVGRTALFELAGEFVFASYLIRLRTKEATLRAAFLNHYFNWSATQTRLKGIASRAVSQSNISASRLKSFLVPIPKPHEQEVIVASIDQVDALQVLRQRRLSLLNGLFRTLLHKLITAEIRVQDLDFPSLEKESLQNIHLSGEPVGVV